jgi:gliding motility-associated-like protein
LKSITIFTSAQELNVYPKKFETSCALSSCLNLNFKAPSIKSTEGYTVQTIPYNPYTFVTPNAITDVTLYTDDRFSKVFDLPFSFCFYDSIYKKAVISSNGFLSFNNALSGFSSNFTVPNLLPSNSYARASIMGCYTDLDASSSQSPPDRKIEWRLEGNAPYRRFIISYYNVGTFQNGAWSANGTNCNSINSNTLQIVLYESNSFIDVYIKNKICQASTSGNKSILGIQNWDRDKGTAAPNKNATTWTAVNEGYEFRPDGSVSLIQSAALYKTDGSLIGPLQIIAVNSDSTNFFYNNYCRINNIEDTIIVKANYSTCSTGLPYTLYDTLYVGVGNALSFTTTISNVKCYGTNTGIITVFPIGGSAPFTFSTNGNVFQSSNIFNVVAGNYAVTIKDAGGCDVSKNVSITEPSILLTTIATTNAFCLGGASGTINVQASGGTPPYTYSINGSSPQPNNIFNVLSGIFYVATSDSNGCVKKDTVNISLQSNLVVSTRSDTTICEGDSTQLFTNSNATNFIWSSGLSLNDSTLKNPIAKPTVTTTYYVKGILGNCTAYDTVTVTINKAPFANAGQDTIICYGKSYTLQGSGGLQYLWLPNSNLNNNNISTPIATPEITTKYWVKVKDVNGCSSLLADTMLLTLIPPLQVYAGQDTTIIQNQPYTLNATLLNAINNNLMYIWSPSFGLDNNTIKSPTAILNNDQTYNLEIIDAEGCKGNTIVNLKVLKGPEIYVPNIFTPNKDGTNDMLVFKTVGIKKINFFKIYNRWGILLFESIKYTDNWNGSYKGKEQPTGTYIFIAEGITEKGITIAKKGTIILSR